METEERKIEIDYRSPVDPVHGGKSVIFREGGTLEEEFVKIDRMLFFPEGEGIFPMNELF